MSASAIAAFVSRAVLFAAAVAALYVLARWLYGRIADKKRPGRAFFCRREALRLLLVFYLAALVEIIALRGHVAWNPGGGEPAQLLPLRTTLSQWRAGVWPFLYHALGNLLWFAPLGMLLPALRPRVNLLRAALAGLLLSFFVETCQWLFASGVPDVDDLLLNALGAAAGCGLRTLWLRVRGGKAQS